MLTYPKVVVADDEIINIKLLEHCLTQAGWQVMAAQDGQQAVDHVVGQRPDLVILDINMPVLDGWQAAAAIRGSSGAAAGVPIIAFTSLRIGEDELRRRGFDGCLAKPCEPAHLVQEVARWRPGDELGGVERLANVFAPAELDALIARLRDQLAEAIAGAPDSATAHRIAGAAGTLGFAQVSESWLALSTGDDSVRGRAYTDARRAIAAIDRRRSADSVTG